MLTEADVPKLTPGTLVQWREWRGKVKSVVTDPKINKTIGVHVDLFEHKTTGDDGVVRSERNRFFGLEELTLV